MCEWEVGTGKSVGALRECETLNRVGNKPAPERGRERVREKEKELFILYSKALAHDEVLSP